MIMFLDWTIFFDIFIPIVFLALLIFVASLLIMRDLKRAFLKVYRIQSKFDIELRKLVNLMSKILNNEKLASFESVLIKELPHEQKKILLKTIDEVYDSVDKKEKDNAYIVETYDRLQEIRRTRDTEVLVYNHKLVMFPYNIYSKFMKISKYELYTTQE